LEQIPDEPSITRALRTGYPQKARDWNREDVWKLRDDEYTNFVKKRHAEKRDTLRCAE